MLLARIAGHATASIKHASLTGARLLVAEPVRSLTVDPVLVVDSLGAGCGQLVLITSDGKSARQHVGDETSPVRWTVMGIVDNENALPIEPEGDRA